MTQSYKCPICDAYHLGEVDEKIIRQRKVRLAAPTMLKALKEIVSCGADTWSGEARYLINIAQAAIDATEEKEVEK